MSIFRHVMFLDFKEGTTDDQIDTALSGLASMPDQVPGILRYEFGLDAGAMEGNPDLALVADFASEADWRAYLSHPAHTEMAERDITPIKESITRVQYIVG